MTIKIGKDRQLWFGHRVRSTRIDPLWRVKLTHPIPTMSVLVVGPLWAGWFRQARDVR